MFLGLFSILSNTSNPDPSSKPSLIKLDLFPAVNFILELLLGCDVAKVSVPGQAKICKFPSQSL